MHKSLTAVACAGVHGNPICIFLRYVAAQHVEVGCYSELKCYVGGNVCNAISAANRWRKKRFHSSMLPM